MIYNYNCSNTGSDSQFIIIGLTVLGAVGNKQIVLQQNHSSQTIRSDENINDRN